MPFPSASFNRSLGPSYTLPRFLSTLSNRRLEHAMHTRTRMRVSNRIGRRVTRGHAFQASIASSRGRETKNMDSAMRMARNEGTKITRRMEKMEEEDGIPARGEIKTALFCPLSCSLSFSPRSFLSILTESRPLYVEKEDTR